MPFITGLGAHRQHEIVSQHAHNSRRVLPPSGLPIGNIQTGFSRLKKYGGELTALTFPPDEASKAPFPFYDRWADTFNLTTEAVVVNQARGLACTAALAATSGLRDQHWKSLPAQIVVKSRAPAAFVPVTVRLEVADLDLKDAVVVWEALDQDPVFGGNEFTFTPGKPGEHWLEAEAHWPDGRRIFAAASVICR